MSGDTSRHLLHTLRFAAALFVAALPLAANSVVPAQTPIKVLLVTGQSNRYHNWEVSSPIVKRQLEDSRRFVVTVATTPPKGAAPNQDMSSFAPKFSDYQAVVLDYEGFEFAPPVKQAFVDYVRNGGGLVVLHAADNAFPGWPEYNEMIGVGGWGGFTPGYSNRTQSAGPKIRWRDGGMVLDNDTPGTAQHPSPHDFLMTVRAADHPIMKGLPSAWLHASDELYSNLRGPAKNVSVLATATAPTSMPNGTGEHEPIIMAITYGKGRVFHDTLGHVGATQKEPIVPMNSVDYIVLLQRGTEWAATGAVTIPVPRDFPTAEKTSIR
jgi:type 1 glutamine amidotransferase